MILWALIVGFWSTLLIFMLIRVTTFSLRRYAIKVYKKKLRETSEYMLAPDFEADPEDPNVRTNRDAYNIALIIAGMLIDLNYADVDVTHTCAEDVDIQFENGLFEATAIGFAGFIKLHNYKCERSSKNCIKINVNVIDNPNWKQILNQFLIIGRTSHKDKRYLRVDPSKL